MSYAIITRSPEPPLCHCKLSLHRLMHEALIAHFLRVFKTEVGVLFDWLNMATYPQWPATPCLSHLLTCSNYFGTTWACGDNALKVMWLALYYYSDWSTTMRLTGWASQIYSMLMELFGRPESVTVWNKCFGVTHPKFDFRQFPYTHESPFCHCKMGILSYRVIVRII